MRLADIKIKCRHCGAETQYNFCSNECARANNDMAQCATEIKLGYSPRDARDFEKFFHVKLADYWLGYLLGFDVTGFDDRVVKSGTQSMKAAIMQTYGIDAVRLIERLLGILN